MKIAIYGYGNLGRGVEVAVADNHDAELVGIFTRRTPCEVKSVTGVSVYSASSILDFVGKIDALIISCGSATDLPDLTPALARNFTVVDSFDTHSRIPEHFKRVDSAAREGGNIAVISSGWDPGLLSLARLYFSAALPSGDGYTFWGRGISQGHSNAIRRIDGVLDARQYTVPRDEALSLVRSGERPHLRASDKHIRECYVVAEDGADRSVIEEKIKNMPDYFLGYDTSVAFITSSKLEAEHSNMSHGGTVIRNGVTGVDQASKHTLELSLTLSSNPEFTGNMLVATARAAYRMKLRGDVGCKTLFDIPPADLSLEPPDKIRECYL